MYRVIWYFEDLQDNEHAYNVGDNFPRVGLSVSEERLNELARANNRQNRPLIEKVAEEVQEEKPKRGRKKKIEN